MILKKFIRPLLPRDNLVVKEIYEEAIRSQANEVYTQQQIDAWSALAVLPGLLDRPLREGKGWVLCVNDQIEAFAVKYPSNRLALLYCRGRSSRNGYATSLLKKLQVEARNENISKLVTEASLLSYPLLVRLGWKIIKLQKIYIAGVSFDRYLMDKELI